MKNMNTLRMKYPLKPIKIVKKFLSAMLALAITAIFVAIIILTQEGANDFFHENAAGAIIATLTWSLFFVFVSINIVENYFYYKTYFYDTDGNNLIIRKGIVSKSEITLPFSRITDIYVDQDMLDRIFGLYDLHFSTATAESSFKAHIDGLDRYGCEEIRKYVLNKINENNS